MDLPLSLLCITFGSLVVVILKVSQTTKPRAFKLESGVKNVKLLILLINWYKIVLNYSI